MVYDWDGKEQMLYQMYILENKSLEEIIKFMKEKHDFTPRYVRNIIWALL